MENSSKITPDISVSDSLIYITFNDAGEFYIGKSHEAAIARGYQGSGSLIKAKIKKHPGTFKTVVLKRGLTCAEAYHLEGILVTEETLKMPGCLNLCVGGCERPEDNKDYIRTKSLKQSITRKHRMNQDPEYKAMYLKSWSKARKAAAETLLNTPYIIDGIPFVCSCEDFKKIRSFFKTHRWYLTKIKRGEYYFQDRGFYLNGIRYTRFTDLKRSTSEAGRLREVSYRKYEIRPKMKTGPKSHRNSAQPV